MARLPIRKKARKRPVAPGDYEAALVRLCKGNRRKAEALILEELERSPELTRQGAALKIVARIRHEQSPVGYRL